jgi:hypothetical protein
MRDIEQTKDTNGVEVPLAPATESPAKSPAKSPAYKTAIIRPSAVKAHCKAKGKRISSGAMRYLDEWLQRKLSAAAGIHNGGVKTISENILAHVGIK